LAPVPTGKNPLKPSLFPELKKKPPIIWGFTQGSGLKRSKKPPLATHLINLLEIGKLES